MEGQAVPVTSPPLCPLTSTPKPVPPPHTPPTPKPVPRPPNTHTHLPSILTLGGGSWLSRPQPWPLPRPWWRLWRPLPNPSFRSPARGYCRCMQVRATAGACGSTLLPVHAGPCYCRCMRVRATAGACGSTILPVERGRGVNRSVGSCTCITHSCLHVCVCVLCTGWACAVRCLLVVPSLVLMTAVATYTFAGGGARAWLATTVSSTRRPTGPRTRRSASARGQARERRRRRGRGRLCGCC